MVEHYRREYYIGEEAIQLRGVLKLMYPFEKGIITDFSATEKMLHFIFYTEFRIDPSEHFLMFPYNPFWSKLEQGKLLEIFFETFNLEGLFLVDFYEMLLRLYKAPDAIIIDVLEDCTNINLYQNFKRELFGCRMIDLGARDLVYYMQRLFRQRGIDFTTSVEREIVRDIAEKHCYFTMDPEMELSRIKEPEEYMLPDGQIIELGNECFLGPEYYFNPAVIGKDDKPLNIILKELLEHEKLKDFNRRGGKILWDGMIPHLPNFLDRICPDFDKSRNLLFRFYEMYEKIYDLDLVKFGLFDYFITRLMYKDFGPDFIIDLIHKDEEGDSVGYK